VSPDDTDRSIEEIGERLFHPRRGGGSADGLPLPAFSRLGATAIRGEIRAVVRRAPQVMVKVTGGGRGTDAIRAHLQYVSKRGEREIEDQDGTRHNGRAGIRELINEWRVAGTAIPPSSPRREAFNIMLSMPRGTEPGLVLAAARAFSRREFQGHRYAMVLHRHQANPHVHLVVRAEGDDGRRLNPRKADLHRFRERFAMELRSLGVEAAATRQAARGRQVRPTPLWELKSGREGGKRSAAPAIRRPAERQLWALRAWRDAARCLARSESGDDRRLSVQITEFVRDAFAPSALHRDREQTPAFRKGRQR
jgi:relaxase-like protein